MSGNDDNSGTLGRIALKKMQVRKGKQGADAHADANAGGNPMNRLVPYLDLFGRLGNDELSRLSRVAVTVVEQLRSQVVEVQRALSRYTDLLSRLSDDELARLTGASPKTIRFWRLSTPTPERSRRTDPDAITRPLTPVRRAASESMTVTEESSQTGPLPQEPHGAGISGKPFNVHEGRGEDEVDVELGQIEDDDDLEVTRDDFF